MGDFRILFITDHTKHSINNSFYWLVSKLIFEKGVLSIDLISKGVKANKNFFAGQKDAEFFVSPVQSLIEYSEEAGCFLNGLKRGNTRDYNVVVLRLPPPISTFFFQSLKLLFINAVFVNDPEGIMETYRKDFLLNFKSICPPMQLIHSAAQVKQLTDKSALVLKPIEGYGGKGIIRIMNGIVSEGDQNKSLDMFLNTFQERPMLAVNYLKNVNQGDKRILVVNGKIIGASLRMPKNGSWICNASMGGSSNACIVEEEEYEIVNSISPVLLEKGIVIYGLDTLVDDNGKRILSELNTASVGGFLQISEMYGEQVMINFKEGLFNYLDSNKL
jgi:glutathione synthase